MTHINVNYQNGFRTLCIHNKSGKELITDAPVDNNGKGESFSPTDLLAAGLLSCMMTILGIRFKQHFETEAVQMSGEVRKIMTNQPRKIASLEVELQISTDEPLSSSDQEQIRLWAETCPVALSLSEEITVELSMTFDS
ncbi:MAG: OsmC family protein [Flavobacteriales bacterium]|nr:OsmC family protein [Flavobacteriales bacterium]